MASIDGFYYWYYTLYIILYIGETNMQTLKTFSLDITFLCAMVCPFEGKDMYLLKGINTNGCWGVSIKFWPVEEKMDVVNIVI